MGSDSPLEGSEPQGSELSQESKSPMGSSLYAKSGVDTGEAEHALSRLLLELAPTQVFGTPSETGVGRSAAVIRVGPVRLALTMNGVGTKLLVAQAAHSYDAVGIDCVALNVNNLLGVGATPLAMLDYIGCEEADPEIFTILGRSLADAARLAEVSIIGGETAQVRDMLRGSAPGRGLDMVGVAIGLVPEGDLLDGSRIEPGDRVIGLASNGIHSNGFSLARTVLLGRFELGCQMPEFGHTLAEELLRPAAIYVEELRALREAGIDVKAAAHISGDGMLNLHRVEAPVGFELTALPAAPPIFRVIEEVGKIDRAEMRVVFNMGVGFALVVPPGEADRALEVLSGCSHAAWCIGHAVADAERRIWIPSEGLVGSSKQFMRDTAEATRAAASS